MAAVSAFMPNSSTFISHTFQKHRKQRSEPLFFQKFGNNKFQCLATQSVVANNNNPSPQRNSANYQPTLWTYDFLQSLSNDYTDEKYKKIAGKLLEDVRRMMKDENAEIWTKLELIDHVQRLGIAYHFEKEIKQVLHTFVSLETPNYHTIVEYRSLHEAALSFRLLRDHGFDVSPDIFERLKEEEGRFKEWVRKDVKGMLSLYEATFVGYEGEDILEEARGFSRMHLKQMMKEIGISNVLLSEEVSHALELPLHRRTQRLEARWYIDAYAKTEDANRVLLEAAILDFNIVQSTLQRDLQEVSRWWKNMGLAAKLSFSRDRLMECFFWTVGMVFEPQFSELRKSLTKVTCFITIIDDVYDVYGTLDELHLFTAAVQRWDINAVNVLPEYMKMCFLALYNTVNEMAYDTLKEHGHNILPYLTKAWADMLEAFLQEAEWSHGKYIPTFKEYFRNAWVSVSGVLILTHVYCFLNHNITDEALQSLLNRHHLFRCPSIIFRLCNDLATSTAELERGEAISSVACYMRENGVSEESGSNHMASLVDESWKKMNKERNGSPFSKDFVERAFNLARISHCTYQYGDGHGAPDAKSKNRIRSLIIEPIQLQS